MKEKNLLKVPWLKSIFKSKYFPKIFQWMSVIIFAFIIYTTLFGTVNPSNNFGIAITWVFWWPLIPLLFFALGRFWCAVCPFSWVSDIVQKFFGSKDPVPKFLKKYGIWVIDIFFIAITWADHIYGIVQSPRGTGYLLLIILGLVIIFGAFFERRTFCRYVCFIGGLSGSYSRTAMLELRATPEICAKCTTQNCYRGTEHVPGCAMFEFPRTMDDNTKCNLCMDCVKTCPNDSIRITPRMATKELWAIRKPKLEEAILAAIIMGIVLVQNITMLTIWTPMLAWAEGLLGTDNFNITFTFWFVIFMALPILLLGLASAISARYTKESTITNFTIFGYAIIPLDLAAHMAHNVFHLLAEGKAVWHTFMIAIGMSDHIVDSSLALASGDIIRLIQFSLLALGFLGSIYVVYRIAKGRAEQTGGVKGMVPHIIFLFVILVINIYAFILPMTHRV